MTNLAEKLEVVKEIKKNWENLVKSCEACGVEKPTIAFSRNGGVCKVCDRHQYTKDLLESFKGLAEECKVCSICNKSYPMSAYFNDKYKDDGKVPYCKICSALKKIKALEKKELKLFKEFLESLNLILSVGKICTNPECHLKGIYQPKEAFNECPHTSDRLTPRCRVCLNLQTKEGSQAKKKIISESIPEDFDPEKYTRECNKCGETLPLVKFYKRKEGLYGYGKSCKDCRQKAAGSRSKGKDFSDCKKVCSKCGVEKSVEYFPRRKGGKYGVDAQCKECLCAKNKAYRSLPEVKERMREKYYNDPQFRYTFVLRRRMNIAVKSNQKVGSAVRDLGCTIPEFIKYLEKKFHDHPKYGYAMTHDNYGSKPNDGSPEGWHHDHIRPLESFDLTNREEYLKAAHYTNYQPLWASENLSKGAKWDGIEGVDSIEDLTEGDLNELVEEMEDMT